jgi:hypothetical protein
MNTEVEKCDQCDEIWNEIIDISIDLHLAPDDPHLDIPDLTKRLNEATERLKKVGCPHAVPSIPRIDSGRRLSDLPPSFLFRTDKVLEKLKEELQSLDQYLNTPGDERDSS